MASSSLANNLKVTSRLASSKVSGYLASSLKASSYPAN